MSFTFIQSTTQAITLNVTQALDCENDAAYSLEVNDNKQYTLVDQFYLKEHNLSASTSIDFNLYDGSLKDIEGNACRFETVQAVQIINKDANAIFRFLGCGASASGWCGPMDVQNSALIVRPRESQQFSTIEGDEGYPVSASNCVIRVEEQSGHDGYFYLLIVGIKP